jgi:hypothetical protein
MGAKLRVMSMGVTAIPTLALSVAIGGERRGELVAAPGEQRLPIGARWEPFDDGEIRVLELRAGISSLVGIVNVRSTVIEIFGRNGRMASDHPGRRSKIQTASRVCVRKRKHAET